MSLLAKLRTKYGEGIGVELFFTFPDLQDDERTYFDADMAAGASSIAANGINLSLGQFILLGQPGSLKSEIVQVSTSVAPTATLVTLQSAGSFAHNRGDIIRNIPYDQITPVRSTDAGSTFSALSSVSIRADSTETYLQRSSDASTDVYKFRFYNSYTTLFSAYSDSVAASGYSDNSIWSVKDRALDQLGEKKSDLITDKFLNDSLQEGRRALDQNPAALRWSFRTSMGTVLGQLLSGQYSVAAPSTLRDRNTNKNILSIRIGAQNRPVVYQDRVRFNQNYLNVVHTTVPSQVTSGATSMVLASTHNLDSAGSIYVANNAVGNGLIAVAYTGNNRATNTLTGCSGISRNISAGTDIWQRAVFGLPTAYTIDSGMVYFDVPLKLDYDGQDAMIDFYSTIPAITTDSQAFDEPFYDLYVSWLKWKIKYKKSNGKIDASKDTDYQEFLAGAGKILAQETPGQRINFIPDTEGFLSQNE